MYQYTQHYCRENPLYYTCFLFLSKVLLLLILWVFIAPQVQAQALPDLISKVELKDVFPGADKLGTPLDREGQITHLFNPRTGLSAPLYHSVSVIAEDATTADALSTAFSLMPIASIRTIVKSLPAVQVYVVGEDKQLLKVS